MGQGSSSHKTTVKSSDVHPDGGETSVSLAVTEKTADRDTKPADIASPQEAATAERPEAETNDDSKPNGQAKNTSAFGNGDAGHGGVVKRRKKKGSSKSSHPPSTTSSNGASVIRKRISFYDTVDASEVLPHLMVGNLPSAKDEDFLARKNVKYVLNLTNEPNEGAMEGVEYKSVLLEDDEDAELSPHLEDCFDFINKAKASGTKKHTAVALVHSYYGISRTSAIVLAYLMKEQHWTLKQAYEHLKERHPSAKPNDGFVIQLLRYDQELNDGRMSMTLKDFYQQP